MAYKEVSNIKKALKKDLNSAECFIMLADMGVNFGTNDSDEQSSETRETVVSSLTTLKQSISEHVEKLMIEIDNAITKMS